MAQLLNRPTKLVLHTCPGDLRARRVHRLQGAPAAGGAGRRQLPVPAPQPAHRDEAQEDAHQVEGDG